MGFILAFSWNSFSQLTQKVKCVLSLCAMLDRQERAKETASAQNSRSSKQLQLKTSSNSSVASRPSLSKPLRSSSNQPQQIQSCPWPRLDVSNFLSRDCNTDICISTSAFNKLRIHIKMLPYLKLLDPKEGRRVSPVLPETQLPLNENEYKRRNQLQLQLHKRSHINTTVGSALRL